MHTPSWTKVKPSFAYSNYCNFLVVPTGKQNQKIKSSISCIIISQICRKWNSRLSGAYKRHLELYQGIVCHTSVCAGIRTSLVPLSLCFVLLLFKDIHLQLKFFFSSSRLIIVFEILSSVHNSFDAFSMGSMIVLRGHAFLFEKLSSPISQLWCKGYLKWRCHESLTAWKSFKFTDGRWDKPLWNTQNAPMLTYISYWLSQGLRPFHSNQLRVQIISSIFQSISTSQNDHFEAPKN